MSSTPLTAIETTRNQGIVSRAHGLKKRLLARLVLVLGSFLLSCLVIEAGLRVAGWPSPGLEVGGRGPIKLRQPGRQGGAFPPGSSGRLRHYDYDVAWVVNSHGFRDRELLPKRSGEWRIGVLGDSFAAGYGVNQDERFGDVWYSQIKTQYTESSLWNLSSPLCGTKCETDILDGIGRNYDLDEVLLVFYGGNDIQDNFDAYTYPDKKDPYQDLPASETARQWLREHSRLATFVWIHAIRAFANLSPPGIYSQADFDRYWPYTTQALKEFQQASGRRQATILYLPAIGEWDDMTWQAIGKSNQADNSVRFLVRDALKTWSEAHSIRFVDATPWLRSCQPSTDCIFPTDGHLNQRGHAIVGNELAKIRDLKSHQ